MLGRVAAVAAWLTDTSSAECCEALLPMAGCPLAEQLRHASVCCKRWLARLRPGLALDEPATRGAVLLLTFLADSPLSLRALLARGNSILKLPCESAWEEPLAGPAVGLAATAQDVWAHCLGPERAEDACVVGLLNELRPQRVLDWGAGCGHFAQAAAAAGAHVDAIEIDPVKQCFLRMRARSRRGEAEIHVVERPQGPYDMLLAINVLDHLQRPDLALPGVLSAMAPRSNVLVVAAFAADGWHCCNPELAVACASTLNQQFRLADRWFERAPYLNHWQRGYAIATPKMAAACLAASTRIDRESSNEGRILVRSPRFFARACELSIEGARLAAALNGRRTIVDLADAFQLEVATVKDFVDELGACGLLVDASLARPARL